MASMIALGEKLRAITQCQVELCQTTLLATGCAETRQSMGRRMGYKAATCYKLYHEEKCKSDTLSIDLHLCAGALRTGQAR
jgi:hypothetical protein